MTLPAASSALPSASSLDAPGSTSSASAAMSSLSAAMASASKALSSESAIASGSGSNPPAFQYVGIALAVGSGLFIGSSFVLKKKGLLASQKLHGQKAGEGHAYLKSWMWWSGMILMILGEILNVVAYAVSSAVLVTPLGALSVVICAILSSIFLKEKLTLFGKLGAALCIVGSTVIAINAPSSHQAGDIKSFMHLFIAPGFLSWMGVCIVGSLILIFWATPRYGKKQMLIPITICSLIGGLSVSTISGIGSAVILTIRGSMQLTHWFFYVLLVFVIVTLLIEINYLNKALELFNTAMVTPTYYVIFTFCTLVTSIVLYQGLDADAIAIVTIVLGFLTICAGISLLQLSKIDPEDLTNKDGTPLDRETTLLIRASRSMVSRHGGEKGSQFGTQGLDDPGVDAVRGGMGVVGSLIRARSARKLHASADAYADEDGMLNTSSRRDLERYELHDAPVRRGTNQAPGHYTMPALGMPAKRDTAISFAEGSENPHGHHAGDAPLRSVSRASNISNSTSNAPQRSIYKTEPASFLSPLSPRAGSTPVRGDSIEEVNENEKPASPSIRSVGGPRPLPDSLRQQGSLSRSTAAPDLRTMWDAPMPGLTPSEKSIAELSLDATQDSAGGISSSPSSTRERTDKVFPGATSGSFRARNKEAVEGEEEEELLNPRGKVEDSDDEEERRKGRLARKHF
ncbi:DUF803-domain-containing protein [Ceraceosorus guamensis]|uniref:DUF803-domain-containing protein n=1 Tax=Ceraceosorus guamensis TaxID=1522189 RepID=A0A316W217_9BASI|nr:DUF803-domain-containing protein [Ceraceosorus guamensis]PWN42601.1 DUF803-domain-containing protein [Ceraceosorus guamensis]